MTTPEPLLTVAEASHYKRTALHREVIDFLARLSKWTDRMKVVSMGRSGLGQDMPVAVLSADRLFSPEATRAAGRPVVLVIANIHAGEVEGKEACLMLARDITTGALSRLMERATVLLIPDYNPDGNDKIDVKNRALDMKDLEGQVGPEGGVGTRTTGEGWNLNRDYMKQSGAETRRLADLVAAWMPHVTVDCHTTDGSVHGYELTFDTSRNLASCPPGPAIYTRDRMLRDVSKALRERTGFRTYFYGNLKDDKDPTKGWESYPPMARYGSHYRGLLGCADILLEAYSYVDFKTRCDVMYGILVEILEYVRSHDAEVVSTVERARKDVVSRGKNPQDGDRVGIAYGVEARDAKGAATFSFPAKALESVDLEAWDLPSQRGHRVPGLERKTYPATYYGRYEPTTSVGRPFAYVIPASEAKTIERLLGHHVEMHRLSRDIEIEVEAYRVTAREPTVSPDVGITTMTETVFHVQGEATRWKASKGDVVVPMAQPWANLAIYLLEPESDDGLARWGFFDHVKVGQTYPVRRILRPAALPTE